MQLLQKPQLIPQGSLELGWPLRTCQIGTIRLGLYIPRSTSHWMLSCPWEELINLGKMAPFGQRQFPERSVSELSAANAPSNKETSVWVPKLEMGAEDPGQHRWASTTVHPRTAQFHLCLHFVVTLSHLGRASSSFWLVLTLEGSYIRKVSGES